MEQKHSNNVVATVETITPQMAEKYLGFNTQNRKPNNGTIRRYATDMKAGNWKLNGQPIIFDVNNILKDGQNRLMACITANKPFETIVVRGVEVDTFDSIDTGHKRNMADMFEAAQIPNARELMQVISKYFGLEKGKWSLTALGDTNITASGVYGNKNILGREEYKTHKTYYVNIVNWVKKLHKEYKQNFRMMKLSIGDIGGCIVYLNRIKGHDITNSMTFFEKLVIGDNTNKVIKGLRDKLIENNLSVEKMTPKGVQSCVAKAWNLYIQDKNKAFKITENELKEGVNVI